MRIGERMGMGGVYREIVPPERIVATERFDESWYPGGAVSTLALAEQGGRTTLTLTVRYEYRAALVRLGIIPRLYPRPDVLERREGAKGFEPRYCPQP